MAQGWHLICVGKLKDQALEKIEKEYLKRIIHPPLLVHEVKAFAENKEKESQLVFEKWQQLTSEGNWQTYLLSEFGNQFHSTSFSQELEKHLEKGKQMIFLMAGAEGFSKDLMKSFKSHLSLSPLTFPHKIARIILIEQIYRAQTIRMNHPYHN